eukprot:m.288627 g.288627  ORF g.288627 m.288627 type:complete len:629 (-) comp27097_c1_seq3:582-2468(-)
MQLLQGMAGSEITSDQRGSVLVVVRMWIGIALRQRSIGLLSRAITLANDTGISLDSLFIGDLALANPSESPTNMEFVKDLLFRPKWEQVVLGVPLTLADIPTSLFKLGNSSWSGEGVGLESEICYISRRTHDGLLNIYVTPLFEHEIVPKAELEAAYCDNTAPMIKLIFPPEEFEKVSRIIGVLYKANNTSDSHSTASIRTQSYHRQGGVRPVSLYVVLLRVLSGPDQFTTFCLHRLVPEPDIKVKLVTAQEPTSALAVLASSAEMVFGRPEQDDAAGVAAAVTAMCTHVHKSDEPLTSSGTPDGNTLELTVESIPASLVTSAALFLGGGTPATEIVFASLQTHEGQLSVYTSPDFELEIATMSEVKIASHISTDHMLRRMFPSDEMGKVSRTIAVLFRTVTLQDTPRVISIKTHRRCRQGGVMPISLYVGLVLVATGPKEFSVFSVYRFAADVDQTKIRTPGKESSPTTQATSAQLLTARSTSADMAPSHHHSDRHFAFGMQQATGCGAMYPGAPFVHSTNAYVDDHPASSHCVYLLPSAWPMRSCAWISRLHAVPLVYVTIERTPSQGPQRFLHKYKMPCPQMGERRTIAPHHCTSEQRSIAPHHWITLEWLRLGSTRPCATAIPK